MIEETCYMRVLSSGILQVWVTVNGRSDTMSCHDCQRQSDDLDQASEDTKFINVHSPQQGMYTDMYIDTCNIRNVWKIDVVVPAIGPIPCILLTCNHQTSINVIV